MIKRLLEDSINQKLTLGKVIIVLGPRQTGKTTLLNEVCKNRDCLTLDGDDPIDRELLLNANKKKLQQIIGNHKFVFIDEAQRIKNIGLTLKIITDQIAGVQLLVSGSSALELANEINEPLTGRKWEYMLYPISWKELVAHSGYLDATKQLEQRLIYGMYPDVVMNLGEEKEILQQLSSSYLYKDLLSYQGIRKTDLIEKLLKALAFQVGNEVSYNELSQLLGVDKNTINHYINLLEKAFIVYRLPSYSRNTRNEIRNNRKIYFYDNGIRNAIIANFQPLGLRQDVGALWENFLMSERLKYTRYSNIWANRYFWRNYQQREIDYIEERDGKLFAFEFKWNKKKNVRFPKAFTNAYPNAEIRLVTPDNFDEFLGG